MNEIGMRFLLLAALALGLALAQGFPKEAIPFEGKTLEGKTFRLADYLGKIPIFLNFWASHCPPCLMEGPEIGALYPHYQGRILFVGVDVQDNPRMARFRVHEWGWTFPVVVDYYADVARAYRVRYLPTSFFIQKDGRILRVHPGLLILRDREGRKVKDYLTPGLKALLQAP